MNRFGWKNERQSSQSREGCSFSRSSQWFLIEEVILLVKEVEGQTLCEVMIVMIWSDFVCKSLPDLASLNLL